MNYLFFALAIALILIGYLCKAFRWCQFIKVYEKPHVNDILQASGISHCLNGLLPCRLGDIYRVWSTGKKMENGWSLSLATVIVDLFLDVLVVCVIFSVLFIISFFQNLGELVRSASTFYFVAFIIIILFFLICILKKNIIKKIIAKFACLFNSRIELSVLNSAWETISSFKNIFNNIKKIPLTISTVIMWSAYFLSYNFFSASIDGLGYDYSAITVFSTLFTQNCFTLILSEKIFLNFSITSFPVLLSFYLLIPAVIITIYTVIVKIITKENQKIGVKYKNILPHLNDKERTFFLERYFSGNTKDKDYINLFLKVNSDVSIIRDYSAGSNATTMLCMNEKSTFYRKYAFGKDGEKLGEQIDWIQLHKDNLPLPIYFNRKQTIDYCSYDMEYSPMAIGLFNYIHSVDIEKSWSILSEALITLKNNLHTLNVRNSDEKLVNQYINDKIFKNLEKINKGGAYLSELVKYDKININGIDYNNISYFEKKFLTKQNLQNIFNKDKYSDIHGDLTIENIICSIDKEGGFYFIDPNTGNLHDSPFLDYSKLLQSLHGGYEFLMSVKDVSINQNNIVFLVTRSASYAKIYEKYKEFLFQQFSPEQVKSIYFHEIVHWLRLMPYKISKDEKLATVFYAGMILVMNDIDKIFGE